MKKLLLASALVGTMFLSGCSTDVKIASQNLARAADMFEIERRIIFYNGITGEYMLSIEGLCSLGRGGVSNSITVTCKTGQKQYKRHQLGLSDNVTYFSEQLHMAEVGVYHYRVIFKPQSIIPNINLETSIGN